MLDRQDMDDTIEAGSDNWPSRGAWELADIDYARRTTPHCFIW